MPLKLVFLVADGKRARLLLRRSPRAYETLHEVERDSAHTPCQDTRTRISASHGAIGAAVERRLSPEQAQTARFVAATALRLNEMAEGGGLPEGWILVAPARVGGQIKRRLGLEARTRLVRELTKDLTKLPDGELFKRLDHISLAPIQP